MHIAQRKELDVHKTKQKRDRNRTTTSLVLDSSMQRGRWEFRLNQGIWLRLSSVFESRRISFLKIFLVIIIILYKYVYVTHDDLSINIFVSCQRRNGKKFEPEWTYNYCLSFFLYVVFFDFSLTVRAAPHECVIRTGQP